MKKISRRAKKARAPTKKKARTRPRKIKKKPPGKSRSQTAKHKTARKPRRNSRMKMSTVAGHGISFPSREDFLIEREPKTDKEVKAANRFTRSVRQALRVSFLGRPADAIARCEFEPGEDIEILGWVMRNLQDIWGAYMEFAHVSGRYVAVFSRSPLPEVEDIFAMPAVALADGAEAKHAQVPGNGANGDGEDTRPDSASGPKGTRLSTGRIIPDDEVKNIPSAPVFGKEPVVPVKR